MVAKCWVRSSFYHLLKFFTFFRLNLIVLVECDWKMRCSILHHFAIHIRLPTFKYFMTWNFVGLNFWWSLWSILDQKNIFRVIIKEQCKIQKRENMLPLAKWKLHHSNEISICFLRIPKPLKRLIYASTKSLQGRTFKVPFILIMFFCLSWELQNSFPSKISIISSHFF